MYVFEHHSRRLLQGTAASPAGSNDDADNSNVNSFDVNTHFSPSMAIILVVLLGAFFCMGFFSIYVKRCTSRQQDETRARNGPPPHPPDVPSQGVDAAFLETLPLVTYSSSKKRGSNTECVVCLTDFNEGEPLCQLPRCKHVFHKECIDMWLSSHTTCPLCRRSVLSDGSTRSFRWGGSGSLRLSLGRRGSGRESVRGSTAGPSTPVEGHGGLSQMDANAIVNFDSNNGDGLSSAQSLPRSHSTGHSLVKQMQSRMLRVESPNYSNTDDVQLKAGCLPLTPSAAFRRSRSMVAIRGDGEGAAPPPVSIGAWMREAGASLKRALSLKRVSPAAAGDFTASSSARCTFDRLHPVV